MGVAELRQSECCPVIGQIEVALSFWDNNITSPETEPTSWWCSNSRTFEEPIDFDTLFWPTNDHLNWPTY